MFDERCEWNPAQKRAAFVMDDPGACTRPAKWSIGNGRRNFHLCTACAGLPEFTKLRVRKAITRVPS